MPVRHPSPKLLTLLCVMFGIGATSIQAIVDVDEDGLSDIWERYYGATEVSGESDDDGDGQNNLSESRSGTDPFDPVSVPDIRSVVRMDSEPLIRWKSKAGNRYRIEYVRNIGTEEWLVDGHVTAQGGTVTYSPKNRDPASMFYRVSACARFPVPNDLIPGEMRHMDTDKDSVSDMDEWIAGTDITDKVDFLRIETFSNGPSNRVEWPTEKGKQYQLMARVGAGDWDVVADITGDGGPAVVIRPVHAAIEEEEYQVQVDDLDSDGDGVTDWEECITGFDPANADSLFKGNGDLSDIVSMLDSRSRVSLSLSVPNANITREENGVFEIHRENGLEPLLIRYTVSGTALSGVDYVSFANGYSNGVVSSGTVKLPFGESSVKIEVEPLLSSGIDLAETVVLTLNPTADYDLGGDISRQVNIIREVALNVRDYGAAGDGVNDDTAAVQAALLDLELSQTHNTLHFPAGTYRLASFLPDSTAYIGSARILLFGRNDLAGRDFVFTGARHSRIYSDLGVRRAHVLQILGKFRSLRMEGMTIEQSPSPKSPKINGEPNGSDGVALIRYDRRKIEELRFNRCRFVNNHASVFVYGRGTAVSGALRWFRMTGCEILNPYGANTLRSELSWGGGQQVVLPAWVGKAVYHNNLFDGGGEDLTSSHTSPGGRLKDGGHFGSPMELEFTGNIVKRMGVEALFHTNETSLLGYTAAPFVIPPADDYTETIVRIDGRSESEFPPGELLSLRSSGAPGSEISNNAFRIVRFDETSRELAITNVGYPSNQPPGNSIKGGTALYLDNGEFIPLSNITGNVFVGTIPPGGLAFHSQTAIASNARSVIENNLVLDFNTSVLFYDEVHTPLYPGSAGSIVSSNLIVTRNPMDYPTTWTYGISSWANNTKISANLVLSPLSFRYCAIADRGSDAAVTGNTLIVKDNRVNGYGSAYRAIGIGIGNTSMGATVSENFTRGFDVGVGPLGPHQIIPYTLNSHNSMDDQLPVDPRGLE